MAFFSRLEARARSIDSLLCVGLDPHPEIVGSEAPVVARDWCLRWIEATASVACAFKPNAAFFEALGADGWTVLREVIAAAGRHAPVILDAKRGDIASTAAAYARAVFGVLGADAVTLHSYLGRDSLEPFLADPERGAFLLCKTSNPGSNDLQTLPLADGEPFYRRVARLASGWEAKGNLGLVVGATDPSVLADVRRVAPDLWILAPGVGEQGGSLREAAAAGLRPDGLGLLVPVSRTIARAADPGGEARRLRDELRAAQRAGPAPRLPPDEPGRLADLLVEIGCVAFGEFTLRSGIVSPFYIDLRRLASFPEALRLAAAAYRSLLDGLTFDRLAAIPHAGLPIGAAVALASGRSMIYPRLDVKEYGRRRGVEGEYRAGETVVVLDDLATTGGSKFDAVERLRAEGLVVRDVVVLIDRQSGARQALEVAGLRLHAVFTLEELLARWERSGTVEDRHLRAAREFLDRMRQGSDPTRHN